MRGVFLVIALVWLVGCASSTTSGRMTEDAAPLLIEGNGELGGTGIQQDGFE